MNKLRETSLYSTLPTAKPREKLLRSGEESLNNRELISVIMGHGVRGNSVFQLSAKIEQILFYEKNSEHKERLLATMGLGEAGVARLLASVEIARRLQSFRKQAVREPSDILPYVFDLFAKTREFFLSFSLNGANEVLKKHVVSVGTLNSSLVHPREVFVQAIADRAAAVLFVHNHPSGNPKPSSDDEKVQDRLERAGRIIGIEVLDHIILGDGKSYSFKMGDFFSH